ncbi:helix-turn-helix domain-containing protein [Thalassospira sp. MCCC 1A03138]|uniref:helix-turn-helix domain-containing protein n=1 Tax=Thalassospira sp. MCCC 1A03138 TaxID=1470576 RepID=UPI000A1F0BEA|nr:helix-turn-helix domain-containing protein [Thalassospira sp. MCCC 1A03138]OSQ32650.1 hypothetical protein TH468_03585 [Thalassospira sp. MCCC 1A03138]
MRWERFFLEEIFKIRHTKLIQRITSFLIDFEERSGENLDGEDETNFPEKRHIVSRIVITPETFSRSLRKLEATGEIAAEPKLRIINRAVLYELSR